MRKRLVDNHVLYGQNFVVEQLMKNDDNLMEYVLDSEDEILEWWLITPFLAELLKREGETVIQRYDCHWWGRTQSGQAIHMDGVIAKIAKRLE